MNTIIILCETNKKDLVLLAYIEPIAKAFGSHIYLIHVAAPDPEFVGYKAGPQHERDWLAETLRHEHRFLQELAQSLRGKGIDASALLLRGETALTILDETKRLHADMLVIKAHHHGLFQKMVTGSIDDAIIHRAHCPVLLVPVAS